MVETSRKVADVLGVDREVPWLSGFIMVALDSDAVELDFVALVFRVGIVFGGDDLLLFLPPGEEELTSKFANELPFGDGVADVEDAEAHIIAVQWLDAGKGKRLASNFSKVVLLL